jgi:hypothetical protein
MNLVRNVLTLVAVAAVVIVRADPPDEPPDVSAMMRAALEAHAALPADPPRLPDLTDVPPVPQAGDERGSVRGDEARREAIDRAISLAAEAAQEALERARDRGPANAGRKVDAESDAAVGLGRAAESRGLQPPVPIVPPTPWER